MADMNLYLVIMITIIGGIGLTLLFFGGLITIAAAFGNKRNLWGVLNIIIMPLTLMYVMLYWDETAYQRKYLFLGAMLVIIAVLCVFFL